jgi:UDP-N-acetylglucosamine acyltransferase
MSLHPRALVHEKALIGKNVRVDPFALVEEGVEIGDDTWIGPHAVLMSGTKVGRQCKIFPGAVLGADPQDLKYDGELSTLELGDRVTVREYCTLNRGTKARGYTSIMDNTLIMAYCHVAHDCHIGCNVVIANAVNLAGHVEIGDYAIIGGMSAVQQFVKIGCHTYIGGGTMVRKDVPPYVKAAREPLSYMGVNTVGLRRRNFAEVDIQSIQDIYRILFVKGSTLEESVEQMTGEVPPGSIRDEILAFIGSSRNGLLRGYNRHSDDES